MKLSIENHVLRLAFGDKKAIGMIADAGFDAMDFSFYWMPAEDNILERRDYLDYAKQIRTWADARGLAITQAHAPFDFKLADSREKQAHDYEMIRRSIECAGIMGAEQIIIHNIPTPDPDDFFKTNLDFFKSFEETARQSHVKIGVENLVARVENRPMPGRLGTPDELNAFLDQLNPEVFCVCIDLGHARLVYSDPADFIRKIGLPRLQSLHVQDTYYLLDAHTLPYLGKQDWADITNALAEINYEGDFTLEVFLFLKAFPKNALPDALKLAHTVGRGLIRKVERAKECRETIAEHYSFRDADQMTSFLTNFLPQHQGDYPCPSGDTLRLRFSESSSVFAPNCLFRLLSAFPYRETLPTLEDIYRWIPDDFDEEEISETMQWMDKVYAFFSSFELTGVSNGPVQQCTDFFIADGRLITCFPIRQTSWQTPDHAPFDDGESEAIPQSIESLSKDSLLPAGETSQDIDFSDIDLDSSPLPYTSPLLRDIVYIPDDVTEIGPRAFYNCDRPIHVYLPASVKTVAEHAFYLEPDTVESLEHRLLFIEHETGDVEFKGAPFNYYSGYTSVSPLVDTTHYFIISPDGSRADQFAIENGIDRSDTIDLALLEFLYLTREFEDSRDDAGNFIELQEVFRKGELAAPYVIAHSANPGAIACACARISFGITSYIRNDHFDVKDTFKWLLMYGAEEDYLRYEDLNDYCAGPARAAVEMMRAESPHLEKALLSLDAYSVAEYIESLEENPDHNKGWRNMFFDGQSEEYSVEEFFKLGELCAKLFITTRSKEWERILEAAKELHLNLTDEERFGCFRREDIEIWSGLPFDPYDEDEDEE